MVREPSGVVEEASASAVVVEVGAAVAERAGDGEGDEERGGIADGGRSLMVRVGVSFTASA